MNITNATCWEELQSWTGNFKGGFDETFVESIKTKLSGDGVVYKALIDAPTDSVVTKKVIGRNGYYFHLTTTNSGAHFIWHDRVANKFIIWGEEYNVKQAMGILKYRIKLVSRREQEAREASMPTTHETATDHVAPVQEGGDIALNWTDGPAILYQKS